MVCQRFVSVFLAGTALVCTIFASGLARAERSELAPETGHHYGEVEDARWGAMGGAMRAMGNGVTSVFGNPAGMATSRVYHIGGIGQIWP
jgi:hypothetical protein